MILGANVHLTSQISLVICWHLWLLDKFSVACSMAGGTWVLKHILPSTRLLIWMHERITVKLHLQVFLRMNICSKHVEDTIIKLKHYC